MMPRAKQLMEAFVMAAILRFLPLLAMASILAPTAAAAAFGSGCSDPMMIDINYRQPAFDRVADKSLFAATYERAREECQVAAERFPELECFIRSVNLSKEVGYSGSFWSVGISMALCPTPVRPDSTE